MEGRIRAIFRYDDISRYDILLKHIRLCALTFDGLLSPLPFHFSKCTGTVQQTAGRVVEAPIKGNYATCTVGAITRRLGGGTGLQGAHVV